MTDTALPTTAPWGKAVWTDFEDNWRQKDANWLQSRAILRYHNAGDRTTDIATPEHGMLTYNESALGTNLDRVEMYSKQHSTWVPLLMLANITSTQDNSTGVALSHISGSGKGVILGPGSPAGTGSVSFNAPIDVMTGVLKVDSTGVTIKTGTKTAKLTTSTTDLISDSPLTVPSISTTSLAVSGSLSVPTISGVTTLTATNISVSGTLTGGILNGASGTLGGVTLGGATLGAGNVGATSYVSSAGVFYGDANGAYMRQRNTTGGAYGSSYVQVKATEVNISGGSNYTLMNSQLRIEGTRSIWWDHATLGFLGYSGPVIYSATDPNVNNVPEGTIWVS